MAGASIRSLVWSALLGSAAACPSGSGGTTDASDPTGSTTAPSTSTTTGTTSSGPESTSSVSTTGPTSTNTATTETGDSTTGSVGSTTGTTGTGTTTADTHTNTGTSTSTGDTGTTDTTTGDTTGCVPTETPEVSCDQLDNDCDGHVDNVDVGDDGFCDCYKIGILGTKGLDPVTDFEVWLADKGPAATRFGTAADHQLTQQELDAFDVLILDRLTHAYTAEEQALLNDWIEAGHGVIGMAGYSNSQVDRDQQNSLAAATGLTYSAPIYIDPVEVWADHPVAAGAQAVQVYGGWRVVGVGEVFVRPQGEPFNSLGTAVKLGEGAAIVFSDEWISYASEWQGIPEVPVFWANMIGWVGPKGICAGPP